MVCIQHGVISYASVVDDESRLVGKVHIAIRVIAIDYVRTATVLEIFRFLPIHQLEVLDAVMADVLNISRTILTDERVPVIKMIRKSSGQSSSSPFDIKSVT